MGRTSVPELAARPIIDILARRPPGEPVSGYIPRSSLKNDHVALPGDLN
jgi:GrpB-like predicted nucleotidyltransferase (UPF0157 family)